MHEGGIRPVTPLGRAASGRGVTALRLSTGELDRIREFFTAGSTWTVNDVANGFRPSAAGRVPP